MDLIYFVKCHDYVKIGKSLGVYERVANIQSNCPYEVALVFVTTRFSENELHDRFDKYRLKEFPISKRKRGKGEWFVFSDEIKEFLIEESGNVGSNLVVDFDEL